VAILSRVENATEALLARCFENYYSLQENAPSGLLDGGVAAAEQPAPALLPAVELCNILRDVLKPGDKQWLTDRFKVAARRRYQRLVDSADATINRGMPPDPAFPFCLPATCNPLNRGFLQHCRQALLLSGCFLPVSWSMSITLSFQASLQCV